MARLLRELLALLVGTGLASSYQGDGSCVLSHGHAINCSSSPVVNVLSNGPVQGFDRVAEGVTVSTFWSIPFAEPPVGAQRFHYAKFLTRRWNKTLVGVNESATCPDAGSSPQSDEDCLFLNVYTPRAAILGKASLPVMFYIYGGGFRNGNAYQPIGDDLPMYDGAPLAGRHDVVVITSNYRTNILGFNMYTKGPNGESGSQAMGDQRLALQWTQLNIKAFGGDPSHVTIFGESAGAFSVMYHLVSPPSWPYFTKAIMQSGTSNANIFFQHFLDAADLNEGWANAVGCPADFPYGQLSCLQSLPAEAFTKQPANYTGRSPTFQRFEVGPVIDGTVHGLQDMPLELVRRGEFAKVPLMLGANKDGGRFFVPALFSVVPGTNGTFPSSHRDSSVSLDWFFGQERRKPIFDAYPDIEYTEPMEDNTSAFVMQFSRVIRDVMFQCSDRALATEWSNHGVDVFLYTFSFDLGHILDFQIGDFHAVDVPFVWRNHLWIPEKVRPVAAVEQMSNIMSCMWATFAYTADPNGGSNASRWPNNCTGVHDVVSQWPKFSNQSRQYYSLSELPIPHLLLSDNRYPDDEFPSDRKCDVWDKTPFLWHWENRSRGADALVII